jgi:hypothetical protein
MFAIVIIAAVAADGALDAVASPDGLEVVVAVCVLLSVVLLLDPPHAVANAATTHMAAQNKPNLFIVTPLDWTLGQDTICGPNSFKYTRIRLTTTGSR